MSIKSTISCAALVCLALMAGCATKPPTTSATGDGRRQACERACTAADPEVTPPRCETCQCDVMAGAPAVCTTRRAS